MTKIGKIQKTSKKIHKDKKTEPQKNITNNGVSLLSQGSFQFIFIIYFFPFSILSFHSLCGKSQTLHLCNKHIKAVCVMYISNFNGTTKRRGFLFSYSAISLPPSLPP